MSISVIIVTYNSSKKIGRLLNSMNNQRCNYKLEVILVDNCSNDRNNLIKEIGLIKNRKFKIITYYRRKNYGFGNSCNYAARRANGSYLLFLNPDTQLLSSSLSTLMDHLTSGKSHIIGGKSITFKENKIHRTVFNKPSIFDLLFDFSNIGKIIGKQGNFYVNQKNIKQDKTVEGVGGAYFLIKSQVFFELGGFDRKIFMYLEDVDLCNRASESGYKIVYCPHSTIFHEGGASSHNKYHIHHKSWYDSREYYTYKYFSWWISTPIIFLFKIERLILNLRLHILQ